MWYDFFKYLDEVLMCFVYALFLLNIKILYYLGQNE